MCQSPFDQYNTHFFGEEGASASATGCSAAHVESLRTRGAVVRLTLSYLETILVTKAHDSLTSDFSEDFKAWEQKYDTLRRRSPNFKSHMQLLYRMGLSRDGSYHWYSFCNKTWEDNANWEHCQYCKTCVHWKSHWRCGVCKKCVDHLYAPCGGCGGKSAIFAADSLPRFETMQHASDSREASKTYDGGDSGAPVRTSHGHGVRSTGDMRADSHDAVEQQERRNRVRRG